MSQGRTNDATRPRVLVIDDEADLRLLLERYLGDQGFRVTTRANARDLSELLKSDSFDMLVLDLMMPEESGLAICQRLRAAGEVIPILMLTAKGDPVDRIIGLESGADDYLAKPFTPSELVARISAQLRRRARWMPATPISAPIRLPLAVRARFEDPRADARGRSGGAVVGRIRGAQGADAASQCGTDARPAARSQQGQRQFCDRPQHRCPGVAS